MKGRNKKRGRGEGVKRKRREKRNGNDFPFRRPLLKHRSATELRLAI